MGVNGRYLVSFGHVQEKRLEKFCSSQQLLIVQLLIVIELYSVNSRALALTPVNSR